MQDRTVTRAPLTAAERAAYRRRLVAAHSMTEFYRRLVRTI